jgi:DNA-binding response OmpR family regulator
VKSSHYRILIVDDEQSIRNLLIQFLSASGYECATASNGTEALDRLGQNKFDAVITDVVMPVMDGITLTREISQKYLNIPVMVMTGLSDEYSAQKTISEGAREFIKKPFSIAEFLLRLNKMMRDHEILCEVNAKKEEIEEISNRMISGLQIESREKIENLRREIEDLKKKLM